MMISKLSLPVFILFSVLSLNSIDLHAGIIPIGDLGEGDGCSALSKPDIDCNDLDIVLNGPAEFCGTMGKKGIQVRPGKNDFDSDEESDGIEACICDSIDSNPNININPGDGSICDSSDTNQRDQFNGSLVLGSQVQGQKYEFCYTFTSFPSDICPQTD